MRDAQGRFIKGQRSSPSTEFRKGQHWRPHQPFRDKDWLRQEYVDKGRSTGDIAKEFGVQDSAILFWLHKHKIPRRSVAEARAKKHWGLAGEANGMYGKHGPEHPGWKGGVTPLRQSQQHTEVWGKVAQQIWKRDKATCRRCRRKYRRGQSQTYHVHHIVSFAVEEVRIVKDNLLLLCPSCHYWVHSKLNTKRRFLGGFQQPLGKEVSGG